MHRTSQQILSFVLCLVVVNYAHIGWTQDEPTPDKPAKATEPAASPLHDVKTLAATKSEPGESARAIHPTLMLNTLETNSKSRSVNRGMLLREIARQAVLIAARDELGAATRHPRPLVARSIPRRKRGHLHTL